MPAPLTPLVDPTPLDGPRIEVAPRLAWVLRMARLGRPDPLSQAAVGARLRARGLPAHARLMSQVESGKIRHGRVVDGYEEALGLPVGRLRAPLDSLCRSSPGAPPDRDDASLHPDGTPLSVEEVSALTERVTDPARTGGDWLRWARAISTSSARGLPTWLAEEWIGDLLGELVRAVGTAYTTRYEAASLLRGGPYGDTTLRVLDDLVREPHAQVVLDLADVVGDRADPAALAWAVDLLGDPRTTVLRAACHVLVTAASTGADLQPEDWHEVAGPLAAAIVGARRHPARREVLVRLLADLPEAVRETVLLALPHDQAPRSGPAGPRVTPGHVPAAADWHTACALAETVVGPLDVPDLQMLARHLYEVVFDPRPGRSFPSAQVLGALPFHDRVVTTLHDWAVRDATPAQRCTTLWRLTQMAPLAEHGAPDALPDLAGVGLARAGAESLACRAVLVAHAGGRVDTATLEVLLASPEHRRHALYAAGLSRDPWLSTLTRRPGLPSGLQDAARWWQQRGGLVRDEHTGSAPVPTLPSVRAG